MHTHTPTCSGYLLLWEEKPPETVAAWQWLSTEQSSAISVHWPDFTDPSCFLTSISIFLTFCCLFLHSTITLPLSSTPLSICCHPPSIACTTHCVHILKPHWLPHLPLWLYLTSFVVIGQVSCVSSSLPSFPIFLYLSPCFVLESLSPSLFC